MSFLSTELIRYHYRTISKLIENHIHGDEQSLELLARLLCNPDMQLSDEDSEICIIKDALHHSDPSLQRATRFALIKGLLHGLSPFGTLNSVLIQRFSSLDFEDLKLISPKPYAWDALCDLVTLIPLQVVNLSKNDLSKLADAQLLKLIRVFREKKLKNLFLESCGLNRWSLASLSFFVDYLDLTVVECLYLGENKLDEMPQEILHKLLLGISANPITKLSFKGTNLARVDENILNLIFKIMGKLEILDLSDTNLVTLSDKNFDNLCAAFSKSNLKQVFLQNNKLALLNNERRQMLLWSLSSIEHLDLKDNALNYSQPFWGDVLLLGRDLKWVTLDLGETKATSGKKIIANFWEKHRDSFRNNTTLTAIKGSLGNDTRDFFAPILKKNKESYKPSTKKIKDQIFLTSDFDLVSLEQNYVDNPPKTLTSKKSLRFFVQEEDAKKNPDLVLSMMSHPKQIIVDIPQEFLGLSKLLHHEDEAIKRMTRFIVCLGLLRNSPCGYELVMNWLLYKKLYGFDRALIQLDMRYWRIMCLAFVNAPDSHANLVLPFVDLSNFGEKIEMLLQMLADSKSSRLQILNLRMAKLSLPLFFLLLRNISRPGLKEFIINGSDLVGLSSNYLQMLTNALVQSEINAIGLVNVELEKFGKEHLQMLRIILQSEKISTIRLSSNRFDLLSDEALEVICNAVTKKRLSTLELNSVHLFDMSAANYQKLVTAISSIVIDHLDLRGNLLKIGLFKDINWFFSSRIRQISVECTANSYWSWQPSIGKDNLYLRKIIVYPLNHGAQEDFTTDLKKRLDMAESTLKVLESNQTSLTKTLQMILNVHQLFDRCFRDLQPLCVNNPHARELAVGCREQMANLKWRKARLLRDNYRLKEALSSYLEIDFLSPYYPQARFEAFQLVYMNNVHLNDQDRLLNAMLCTLDDLNRLLFIGEGGRQLPEDESFIFDSLLIAAIEKNTFLSRGRDSQHLLTLGQRQLLIQYLILEAKRDAIIDADSSGISGYLFILSVMKIPADLTVELQQAFDKLWLEVNEVLLQLYSNDDNKLLLINAITHTIRLNLLSIESRNLKTIGFFGQTHNNQSRMKRSHSDDHENNDDVVGHKDKINKQCVIS